MAPTREVALRADLGITARWRHGECDIAHPLGAMLHPRTQSYCVPAPKPLRACVALSPEIERELDLTPPKRSRFSWQ